MSKHFTHRHLDRMLAISLIGTTVLMSGCSSSHQMHNVAKVNPTSSTVSSEQTEEVLFSGRGETSSSLSLATDDRINSSTDAQLETAPDGLPILDAPITKCAVLHPDGLSVEYEKPADATEEEARTACMLDSTDLSSVGDAGEAVQAGDTVTISLTASVDGKEDDSLTKIHAQYGIGSGLLGHSLEQGLIGAYDGEQRMITVTYPAEDNTAGEAGHTVLYRITVESIDRPRAPDDQEVKEMLSTLQAGREEASREARYTAAKAALVKCMTVTAYPEKLVRMLRSEYESPMVTQFGSINNYLDQAGMTRSEFKEAESTSVFESIRTRMLFDLLREQTGLTVSSAEYKAREAKQGVTEDDPDELLFEVMLDHVLYHASITARTAKPSYEGENVTVQRVQQLSESAAESLAAVDAKASDDDSFPETTY